CSKHHENDSTRWTENEVRRQGMQSSQSSNKGDCVSIWTQNIGRKAWSQHAEYPDFLNMYFRDTYKPIPSTYNLVLAMLWRHPEHVDLNQIRVVHYCANGSKPWKYDETEEHMEREDIKMLVKKWWDIYEDPSLDYKNFMETESKLNPITTAVLATKESDDGDVLTSLAPSAA
ncbi:hypothetical protein F2Q68_00042795, partial [Brassica cretica]